MFSNTSAELSLNAPARCISAVTNDTNNHRFLVGTCSLPPSHQNGQEYMGGLRAINPLYLLRYHEEMNEMAVDAQLDFGTDENTHHGEIWSCSSVPMDSRLVITCRSASESSIPSQNAQAETALWRIPESAMREDDIEFYHDEDDVDGNGKSEEISKSMEKICDVELGQGRVTDMQWNPRCIPNRNSFDDAETDTVSSNLLIVQSRSREVCLSMVDCDSSCVVSLDSINLTIPTTRGIIPNPPKASWDPHNDHVCAVTLGTSIAFVDMRTPSKVINGLKNCHRFGVTDVDYNPNKPSVISSSGQDALIKFWDLRYTASYMEDDYIPNSSAWSRTSPIRTIRGGHNHWATCIKYNAFHDQLLLSGGTDSIANLWRISSISSAPLFDLGDNGDMDEFDADIGTTLDDNDSFAEVAKSQSNDVDNESYGDDLVGEKSGSGDVHDNDKNAQDIRVLNIEMRDSVYDVAWSAADPWVFASLGYDGNVVVNHVPSKEKYKILL